MLFNNLFYKKYVIFIIEYEIMNTYGKSILTQFTEILECHEKPVDANFFNISSRLFSKARLNTKR